MKLTVQRPTDIYATHIRVALPYDDEDEIPDDFPGADGEMITLLIDLDTSKIVGWPAGRVEVLYLKVCDGGVYEVLDGDQVLVTRDDIYVPDCLPNDGDDYFSATITDGGSLFHDDDAVWKADPSEVQALFDAAAE